MEPKLGGVYPLEDGEFFQGDKEEPVISGEGLRYDKGKLRFDLIPAIPLMELAEVFTKGAEKYADRNWQKGMKWSKCFAPIMRHLWKWWSGEKYDQEDGLSHLAHACWGCMALMEYEHTCPNLDDRHMNIPLPSRFSGVTTLPTGAKDPNTCQTSETDTDVPVNEEGGVFSASKPVGTITRY